MNCFNSADPGPNSHRHSTLHRRPVTSYFISLTLVPNLCHCEVGKEMTRLRDVFDLVWEAPIRITEVLVWVHGSMGPEVLVWEAPMRITDV